MNFYDFLGESLCVENGWALCDQNEKTGRWQDGWKIHDTTTQIGQVSSSKTSQSDSFYQKSTL